MLSEKVMWWFGADGMTSLASRAFHVIGTGVIGSTEKLGVDDEFYFDNEDRTLPSAEQYDDPNFQRQQLFAEGVRRRLQPRLALIGSVLSFATCTAIWVAGLGVGGIAGVFHHESGSNSYLPAFSGGQKAVSELSNDELKAEIATAGRAMESEHRTTLNAHDAELRKEYQRREGGGLTSP
jgi:hypothetical protein